VVITGSTIEDAVLTADTSSIGDADGLAPSRISGAVDGRRRTWNLVGGLRRPPTRSATRTSTR